MFKLLTLTSKRVINEGDLAAASMGANGFVIINNTDLVTFSSPNVGRIIVPLEDSEFETLTSNGTTNGHETPSVASDFGTALEGVPVYGLFTEVKLSSGRVIVYM